jgi:GT2 family glycosyltransferase
VRAAKRAKIKHEIIVVDNGSVGGDVRFLRTKFPKVEVIALKRNIGFSAGNNLGVKHARGDMILVLSNDIVLDKDALRYMFRHFKDPDVFGVSPKLIMWDMKTIQAEFLGCDMVLGTVVQSQPNLGKPNNNSFKEPRITFFSTGGASIFDAKKFKALGGFDENLFSPFYWEDVDLSYRAYKRGWKCIYEPKSIFYHKHSATLSKSFTREQLLIQELRNRFIFTWSNLGGRMLLEHFIFLPFVFARSAFRSRYRNRRFLDVIAFFKAVSRLKDIMRRRLRERKFTKLSDRDIFNLINTNEANRIAPVQLRNLIR